MSWCNLQTFADSTCSTHTMRKYEAANAVVFMETKHEILTCRHDNSTGQANQSDDLQNDFGSIWPRTCCCARVEFEWGFSHPFPVKTCPQVAILCLWGMVSLPRALDGWVSSLRSPLWIGEWLNASENCWRLAMPSCRCGYGPIWVWVEMIGPFDCKSYKFQSIFVAPLDWGTHIPMWFTFSWTFSWLVLALRRRFCRRFTSSCNPRRKILLFSAIWPLAGTWSSANNPMTAVCVVLPLGLW